MKYLNTLFCTDLAKRSGWAHGKSIYRHYYGYSRDSKMSAMAGDCDFFLRIVVSDLEAYRKFQIHHLNKISGIQNVKTDIPLQKLNKQQGCP